MDTKLIKQKILDLAIRGKLVPQNPADEPASVLLERIKAEKAQLIKEGKIKKEKPLPPIEEVPFEIPESWEWCSIKDVLSKITDGTHHSPESFPIGDYKYITAKNIKFSGIDLTNVTYVDKAVHREIYSRCNPEYGDILYIKDGATTGVVTINTLNEEFSLLSSVALLKPLKLVDNKFICYFLQSSYCYDSVRSTMKGVGITRITLIMIGGWLFPLPPFEEQKRIVAEIDRWFKWIDELEQNQQDLHTAIKQAKSKILDLAIHGKLVPQDANDEPADTALKRYSINTVNESECVPVGWSIVYIRDFFNIVMGQSPSSDSYNENSGIEFHQGKICFSELYLGRSNVYTTSPIKLADANSLLICVRAPVGIVNITKRKICIGRGLCSLKPKADCDTKLFFYFLKTYREKFESKATGSTFKAISADVIKKELIPIPPFSEQKRIVTKIEELFAQLDKIEESLN